MRIGINATCINDRPSGARQRFVGLTRALAGLMPEDDFVVFEPDDCRMEGWFAGLANVTTVRTPLHSTRRLQRFLRGLPYWRRELASQRFHLFEALHMPATRAPTGKTLLTIHDVRGIYPENNWFRRQLFRRVLRRSLARADHVVTVSHAMRSEILAFSNLVPVSVVWNGVDAAHFADIDPAVARELSGRLRLPTEYLLAVGHFEPRKNYAVLVEALASLHRDGIPLSLVIVGNDSGERARIEQQIGAAGLRSSVTLLSGLTDEEVKCLYRGASMLVFPSRYEGFGIPLLEAMGAGIPVVASDIPVFREILGDAACYFDPDSAEEMASSIRAMHASPDARVESIGRGTARVREFGFEVLARRMMAVYRTLLEHP